MKLLKSKKIFFLISTILIMLPSNALFAKDFSLLVKGGYAGSTFVGGDAISSLATLNSFKVGLGFEIGVSDLIAIQPELTYVENGASTSSGDNRLDIVYSYLKIPVWLKFPFGGFYIGPGLYLGLNIGSELRAIVGGRQCY